MSVFIITTRSEEHTSELQSLMRISYAVFCFKKKNFTHKIHLLAHFLLASYLLYSTYPQTPNISTHVHQYITLTPPIATPPTMCHRAVTSSLTPLAPPHINTSQLYNTT